MSDLTIDKEIEALCSNNAVSNWLSERNQLLVQYFRLSGERNTPSLPDNQQINQFCGLLIDYVSAGHFEVYETIVSACETNGPGSKQLLERLYPEISQTTDIVVSFNEKYAQISDNANVTGLDQDLSRLGEAIARRVELEDNLIDTLRTKH